MSAHTLAVAAPAAPASAESNTGRMFRHSTEYSRYSLLYYGSVHKFLTSKERTVMKSRTAIFIIMTILENN